VSLPPTAIGNGIEKRQRIAFRPSLADEKGLSPRFRQEIGFAQSLDAFLKDATRNVAARLPPPPRFAHEIAMHLCGNAQGQNRGVALRSRHVYTVYIGRLIVPDASVNRFDCLPAPLHRPSATCRESKPEMKEMVDQTGIDAAGGCESDRRATEHGRATID